MQLYENVLHLITSYDTTLWQEILHASRSVIGLEIWQYDEQVRAESEFPSLRLKSRNSYEICQFGRPQKLHMALWPRAHTTWRLASSREAV